MAYNFSSFKKELQDAKEWLAKEFMGLRSGRATPSILDSVRVDAYGSKISLEQVGAISMEDARTIRITPWDTTQIQAIEKGIRDANTGLSVVVDGKNVRAILPELTAERREQVIKQMKEKLEEGRVKVRTSRDNTKADIVEKQKKGDIDEDEKFRALEEMQDKVQEANNELESLAAAKEKEIRS